jgi:ornithine cyclodeaminase
MPNLRLIGAADADRLVDMRAAIDAMARAFEQIAQGRAVVPKRLGLDTPNGIVLSMPGFLADDRALAIKVVTVFPQTASVDSLLYMVRCSCSTATRAHRAH